MTTNDRINIKIPTNIISTGGFDKHANTYGDIYADDNAYVPLRSSYKVEIDGEEMKVYNSVRNLIDSADLVKSFSGVKLIKKVIFNPPATIVYWYDGKKTVVKAREDEFSEEHGLAMAIARRVMGSRSAFLREVEKAKRPVKQTDEAKDQEQTV